MASRLHDGDRYSEKIMSIQQRMHQREKRRLELERELFAYSRSDSRISQIKCSKLRSYLKEISDREARARTRNLELLRDVACIEISMREYRPDHGLLRQQKADLLKKVSEYMKARKQLGHELDEAKVEAVHGQLQDSHVSQPSVEIFTGHQTSRGSDTGAAATTTSVLSHRAPLHSPNRSPLSCQHLPSGLLKDFRGGGEDAADSRARLSDDISGSIDSPDCCGLSNKHERTTGPLPSDRAFTEAAGSVPFRGGDGNDEQEASPLVTLMEPEKSPSPGSSGPMRGDDPPPEKHRVDDEEGGLGHLMPETGFGKEAEDMPGKCSRTSTARLDVQLSESSASDQSISLTESELEEDPAEDSASQEEQSQASSLSQPKSESRPSADSLKSLSQEGLFNLLDSIEGRLHGEQISVYGDSSIDARHFNKIISLCDGGGGLNNEDLEACGAVVLHELQRLSWSMEKGCLLPEDLVSDHGCCTEPRQISASLPPDAAWLWDRWFKHALMLKERHVLGTERLVQLFTPLLLRRRATYSHQAKVLLRTLLSRSSEECPSEEEEVEDDDGGDLSSSSSSPAPPLADSDVKPARPLQKQQIQGLQSAEEDSQDESPVESGPIRETRAYQLLRQSAMLERLQCSEEEEEEDSVSGINGGHEEDPWRAKRSSHQDPYPRFLGGIRRQQLGDRSCLTSSTFQH
ncbi:centrosomal protein kizuna isoform 2-T2 [Pholidichthys leucotaenia]